MVWIEQVHSLSFTKMPRNHQVPIHQVSSNSYNMYEEFEVESCLSRRVVQLENRRKVQYLLKYVGYDTPEWTDFSNCNNCRSLIREFLRNERAATLDQAGPADVNGEVELDGEALLYCEALLASEASPLGIGDSVGEPEQVSDGQDAPSEPDILLPAVVPPAIFPPAVIPPAILPPAVIPPAIMPPAVETPAIMPPIASKQAQQAMALLGQGFRLLGPVLRHLVASEKAGLPGPSSPLPGPSSPRPGSATPRPGHHSGSPKAGPASTLSSTAGPSKRKKFRSEEKKWKYKICIKFFPLTLFPYLQCKTKGHISKFCPEKANNFPPPVIYPPSFPPPPVILPTYFPPPPLLLPPSFPPPPHYYPRPPFPVPHPTFHYPNFNGFNGACSIHKWNGSFKGQSAFFKMTSVCGHVMSLDFTGRYNQDDSQDLHDILKIENTRSDFILLLLSYIPRESMEFDPG
ncbi:hypothetical protein OUZ56_028509 [Daphnia magna]|uniref:Chromo domain-containing protein n=1 Tax=Daphnia magna TaxID=35525 RepID=A0ABR0B430_9CRUS|nr:hypothetical protein OUZ56_028509 [Daphnia magna]